VNTAAPKWVAGLGFVAAVLAGATGCAYRLPPGTPPFQQRLRIIDNNPDLYVVRAQGNDYAVPKDGRIAFTVGLPRQGCSVYLFNVIPIRRPPSPTEEKIVSIMLGTSVVQRLSVQDLASLPSDVEGVPQLHIPNRRGPLR
jgi:hypothetical protein